MCRGNLVGQCWSLTIRASSPSYLDDLYTVHWWVDVTLFTRKYDSMRDWPLSALSYMSEDPFSHDAPTITKHMPPLMPHNTVSSVQGKELKLVIEQMSFMNKELTKNKKVLMITRLLTPPTSLTTSLATDDSRCNGGKISRSITRRIDRGQCCKIVGTVSEWNT